MKMKRIRAKRYDDFLEIVIEERRTATDDECWRTVAGVIPDDDELQLLQDTIEEAVQEDEHSHE